MQQELVARNWRELIRPSELEADGESANERYGRFSCEPLERGFGTTLGNALRRVLLSSLQGAAITSVRINGVLHEFSTIPGVMEDMSDIVLNLKEVRLRLHSEGPRTLRLHSKGEGVITAGDLSSEDSGVEVLNPDMKVATLSPEADVEIELTVGTGKGYVPAEKNKTEEMSIGTVPIDSVFSPVQKVNYTVTPARVGRETDFDRLNLEVWTDGTVAPVDAVALHRLAALAGLGRVLDRRAGAVAALDSVTLEGVVVRRTSPQQIDQKFGIGIVLHANPNTGVQATALLSNSLVEESYGSGVLLLGSSATLDGLLVLVE